MEHEQAPQLSLPPVLTGQADILRLRRELENLQDYLHQAALRHTPADQLRLPKTSRMLEEFAKLNNLNLMHRPDHETAMTGLNYLSKRAPQLHVGLSADPSSAFAANLVTWIRENIHPHALVQIGLQPNIAAGAMLRTTNKQFDLSLRASFVKHRDILIQQLEKHRQQPAQVAAPTPTPTTEATAIPVQSDGGQAT
ncbi:hypothetical protein KDA23_00250 [Candidatus Saccharibacteria bacterium]|nr:hypothetical protein [Candidatus Saccharibacteria bacterium]